jgi:hypothetical protein
MNSPAHIHPFRYWSLLLGLLVPGQSTLLLARAGKELKGELIRGRQKETKGSF